MKKEIRKQFILFLAIFIPLLSFMLFMFIGVYQREKQLKNDPEYAPAIIIDQYVGPKARDFVTYKFLVNNKVYFGHEQYFPRKDNIEIGDTCTVIYCRSNPDIHELVTDKNNIFLKHNP